MTPFCKPKPALAPGTAQNFFTYQGSSSKIPLMSTLGLSGPPSSNDSLLKRLFWPSIGDAADADMLGQQGFWICLIVSLLTIITTSLQGHWLLGLYSGVFFFIGGIGIREHDVIAAIAVTVIYWMNIVDAILIRQFPGFLVFIAGAVLTANIRGCIVASQSARIDDPDAMPTRFNETWRDKIVDQLPARIWPRIRIAFYVLAAMTLLLVTAGSVAILIKEPRVVQP